MDFNMDLANILQACGQLKQLDVPKLRTALLFDGLRLLNLPALPMVEKLRVKDVDLEQKLAWRYVGERLPRLQEVHVDSRMQGQGLHLKLGSLAIHQGCYASFAEPLITQQCNATEHAESRSWLKSTQKNI